MCPFSRILSKPIQSLLSCNRPLPRTQPLRLYRQILKFTAQFTWANQHQQPWRDILRKSARKQFDQSKLQTDYMLVMKMMVTARECMDQLQQQVFRERDRVRRMVEETRLDRERLTNPYAGGYSQSDINPQQQSLLNDPFAKPKTSIDELPRYSQRQMELRQRFQGDAIIQKEIGLE